MRRACPLHGFTELTQVDTFYNGLNDNDQDSLNAAAGGNLLSKTTREALNIIENKSKVRYSRNKPNASRMNTNSRESDNKTDERIDKLADQLSTLVEIVSKKVVTPAPVKANQASTSGTLSSNTIPNPKGEMKAITTRSSVAYEGPSIPANPTPKKVVERETEETTDKEKYNFQGSTAQIPPPIIPISILEPDIPKTLPKTTPIPELDVPKSLPKPNIPYPSRLNQEKSHDKASNQMEKIFQIIQDLRFDISFVDALLLMPRFAPTIKNLLMNKEKLLELAKIPLNENCSAMLLKKLPEKLGDPGKFLNSCNFLEMDVCHALADLGASINLMPLSIWKKLSLPELTPTRMTLELGDRSITHPKGVAEDVFVKVRSFHFLTDFVVVDFEADPRVPLILGRSFLRIGRALINVDINPLFDEVLEDIECKDSYDSNLDESTFLVTPLSDSNKDECLALGDDIEILLHHDPILYDAPIDKAECFDPGGDNDEIDAFLAIEVPTYIEEGYYDSEGDILYLESLLSDDNTHNLSSDVFFDHEPDHDTLITFSPKSDPLHHEFAGGVITIPPRIVRKHEDYISRMSLLCGNSSSRSPENFHTIIESLPTSTTLVEDSDSNREEIDIFSRPDDSIPPGIESDFDSEEDIIDNLLNNDPIPEYERLTFDMEPDVPVINNVYELNEDECFDPGGGEINVEVDDSFTFVIRTFLPYLTYPEVSPLLSSTENEDTIFDLGIFAFHFSSQEPVVVKCFMEFCSSTCFIPKDE
ncbi:reverse transcriptase domain-containing protein [Tanacetum coccineum]